MERLSVAFPDASPEAALDAGSNGDMKSPRNEPRFGKRRPDTPDSLTAREREVLRLFAEGLSTSQIAHRLSISSVTVRNHAQRILFKLGVHTRLAAVARAYALGLIPFGPFRP